MSIPSISTNSFLAMPYDVKNHICSYLDFQSLMNLRSTCITFKSEINQIFSEQASIDFNVLDIGVNAERLGFLTKIFPMIRKVVFSPMNRLTPQDIVSFIESTPSLEEIDLSAVNIDDSCLKALEGLTSLKKIVLSDAQDRKPKMKRSEISSQAFIQFLERSKNIQKITLRNFRIDEQVIKALSGKEIVELCLPTCQLTDSVAFADLLSKLSSLRILNVLAMVAFDDDCLLALSNSGHLAGVNFSSCRKLSPGTIEQFMLAHPSLVSIHLNNTNFDYKALDLVQAEGLKCLSFYKTNVQGMQTYSFISKNHFPVLEQLVIDDEFLDDEFLMMRTVASNAPNIRTIGSALSSQSSYQTLAQTCKKLKTYHQKNAFINEKWIETLCSLQALEELSLSDPLEGPLTALQFRDILNSCKKLKVIKLTPNCIGTGCLNVLAEHGSQIRSLRIQGTGSLLKSEEAALQPMIESMKGLHSLVLDFGNLPEILTSIRSCRHLQFFDISHTMPSKREYYEEMTEGLEFIGEDDFTETQSYYSDTEESDCSNMEDSDYSDMEA